jgi:hypothetical protein
MADAGSVIYSRNPAADEKTHPPLDKRIEILKCLDSGIGLNAQNYAEAYESVLGTKISFNDQPAT